LRIVACCCCLLRADLCEPPNIGKRLDKRRGVREHHTNVEEEGLGALPARAVEGRGRHSAVLFVDICERCRAVTEFFFDR
jgi:hypothetical protein